jgi:hypothetical protein
MIKHVMRDKKARIGQDAAGRLTLVKKRNLIQVILYAVAPDRGVAYTTQFAPHESASE